MRNYLLLTFCFLGVSTFAQSNLTLTGKIIDGSNLEPITYAHVIYEKKSIGTTTMENGTFIFSLRNVDPEDTIVISHVGYQPAYLPISNFRNDQIISLTRNIFTLDEVVISAKDNDFKDKRFVMDAIKQYNQNRRESPHIAVAHYREKAKKDDTYIMYMESIGYSMNRGEMKDATGLSEYSFFAENTKYHTSHPELEKIIMLNPTKKFNPGGSANLKLFRNLELRGILSVNDARKCDFSLDSSFTANNNYYSTFLFENGEVSGEITINQKTKNIKHIKGVFNAYFSNVFHRRVDASVEINLSYYDNTPFISSINAFFNLDGIEYNNTLFTLVQKFDHFSLDFYEFQSLNVYDKNPYFQYDSEEWKKFNIAIDEDYPKIALDLAGGIENLELEFMENSNTWFGQDIRLTKIAVSTINKLKKEFL